MLTAGIDIGGTQLRAGIFDENHTLLVSHKAKNDPSRTAEENLDVLLSFLSEYKAGLKGVGIGCPGPMDIKNGKLLNLPNLSGWDNFEIVNYTEEKLGLPVVLNNDANVAGLAEAVLGAGKDFSSIAFIGISTGIGGAFVYDKKILNGAHSNAAEFWNMIVNEDPRHHKNAAPGSLNEQCSGSGLATAASAYYGTPTDAKELFRKLSEGDKGAAEIVEKAAEALARGIANITCTLDPEAIIIGGSVAIHNPGYVNRAVETAKKLVVYPPEQLIVLPAEFGDDAGLVGASLLISTDD